MSKQNRKRMGAKLTAIATAVLLFALSGSFIWYHRYYKIPALKMTDLEQFDFHETKKLMIVAHPDDETLWGGAHLLDGGYLIVCMTHGTDKVRSGELRAVAEASGNRCLVLCYPDKTLGRRDDWSMVKKQMEQDISVLLECQDWELVVTHNQKGEYGHVHHQMTHNMVVSAYEKEHLTVPLYCFGTYYSAERLPEVQEHLPRISDAAWEQKKALLANYHSQERVVENLSHMTPYENWTLYQTEETVNLQ